MSSTMTLQEAADRLGVHYMTAYRYVRLGKLEARKEGGTWVIEEADLDALRALPEPATGDIAWDERLERLLVSGDESAAWATVESALASGHDAAFVYQAMIGPAMNRIGARWEAGELDVADEHRASLIATRMAGRLSPHFNRRGRTRTTVIVTGAPNDHHSLSVMTLADLLRGAGYAVVALGGAVPAESLARTVSDHHPVAAVVMSAGRPRNETAIREAIDAARQAGAGLIIAGGAAITDEATARDLGADAHARSLDEAVALIEA